MNRPAIPMLLRRARASLLLVVWLVASVITVITTGSATATRESHQNVRVVRSLRNSDAISRVTAIPPPRPE